MGAWLIVMYRDMALRHRGAASSLSSALAGFAPCVKITTVTAILSDVTTLYHS
jgi:hypothetical protein